MDVPGLSPGFPDIDPMHDVPLPGQQDMDNRRKDPSGLMFSGTRLTYKDDVLWCTAMVKHLS